MATGLWPEEGKMFGTFARISSPGIVVSEYPYGTRIGFFEIMDVGTCSAGESRSLIEM